MYFDFDKIVDRTGHKSAKWEENEKNFGRKDILPMWIADMDFKVSPIIMNAMQNKLDEGIFGYVHRPKTYAESVIKWSKNRHNIDINKDSLVYSPGVMTTISIILKTIAKDEEKILIQTPVYSGFIHCIENNNKTIVENKLVNKNGKWSIDFIDFEEKIITNNIKWFMLCSPHNPIGRVWEKFELEKLGEICLKHGVRIISDEIWRDIVFNDKKFISISSISDELYRNTITCFSPTKTFNLAGLQASFAEVPCKYEKDIIKNELIALSIKRNNSFSIARVEAAYENGEEWLNECISYIESNINFVKEYIKDNIKDIKVEKPEATYLLWLDFSGLNLEHEELREALVNIGGIGLSNGTDFGKEGEKFFRMNVACPRKYVEEAMLKIKNVVEKLR